jgi:hypothetical protein
MKIEVDVPDVDGMPVELWLALGRTGYEVHAVSFYNSDDATVVFGGGGETSIGKP